MKKYAILFALMFVFVQASSQLIFTENTDLAADDYSSVAFYEQFSYKWTDAEGAEHESLITEEATDPNQIFELLKWAYADERIPGTKYIDDYNETEGWVKRELSYPNTYGVSQQASMWGIDTSTLSAPTQHGLTVFVVNLKDDFIKATIVPRTTSELLNYIGAYIKSVRLITGQTRVDNESNPGYILNFKGLYNKFFVISKGRLRATSGQAPFYAMYEEFSPGNSGPTIDVYDVLYNGNAQSIYHDCGTVISMGTGHYMSMGELVETANYDLNMCLFMPDYRLVYWTMTEIKEEMPDFTHPTPPTGRDANGVYTWYNPKYLPKFFLHTVTLDNATAERSEVMIDEHARQYLVSLDWTSKYADLDTEIDETYAVYKIVNGDVTLVADGLTEPVYEYYEPQRSTGYEIMYYVTAQPLGLDGYTPVESNVRSVVIPGYDPLESLRLDIDGDYESSYLYDGDEYNYYTNTIVAKNSYVVDYMAGFHLTDGTELILYRMLDEAGATSESVAKVIIGTVTEAENADGSWTRTFDFTIEYASGVVPTDAITSGTLSCVAETQDGLDAAKVEFGRQLKIIDQFKAATDKNEQPERYYYQLKYTAAVVIANGETDAHSNIVSVPVFKTDYNVNIPQYSKTWIEGDTSGTLDVSNIAYINFQTQNHPEIRDYTIYRNGEMIAMAQRTQEGSYSVMTYKNGSPTGTAVTAESGMISVMDDLSDLVEKPTGTSKNVRYVIVITTFSRNFATNGGKVNTYGSVRQEIPIAGVAFTSITPVYNTHNHEGKFHYVTKKDWNTYLYSYGTGDERQLAVDSEEPHYRLWRRIDGGDWELISFSNADYNTFVVNDDANLEISSNDSFFYDPIDDIASEEITGREFNVDYRLRVYAHDAEGMYRVAEANTTVLYKTGNVTTEIDDVVDVPTSIRVYPNPTADRVVIEAAGDVAIYNLSGREVVNISDGETKRVVDISHLPSGYYVVKTAESAISLLKK